MYADVERPQSWVEDVDYMVSVGCQSGPLVSKLRVSRAAREISEHTTQPHDFYDRELNGRFW